MQDRFKFRIFDTENKTMHNTDFVVCSTGFVGKLETEDDGKFYVDNYNLTIDNKCILMQCTGLKDKNGKLIFEGDVVKDHNNKLSKVIFDKRGAYFGLFESTVETGYITEFIIEGMHLEVIGNIYENPELLEAE